MEEIQALIEKEIDRRVQEKLTTFIELVSKTYDISMKVLLRDLSKPSSGNTEPVGCGPICMVSPMAKDASLVPQHMVIVRNTCINANPSTTANHFSSCYVSEGQ